MSNLEQNQNNQMKTNNFEPLLTYEELAQKTGMKVSWLKKAKTQFKMPAHEVEGIVRFRLSEFDKWFTNYKGSKDG